MYVIPQWGTGETPLGIRHAEGFELCRSPLRPPGPDSVRALGGECDVKVFGDFAILQPETRNVIDGETAQRRLIELVGHVDPKRLKQLLVKVARAFQVRDGEINMGDHGFSSFG